MHQLQHFAQHLTGQTFLPLQKAILQQPFFVLKMPSIYTGCPKIKLAFGKRLEIATHGFKMCILNIKRDKLGPNPLGHLLGHS